MSEEKKPEENKLVERLYQLRKIKKNLGVGSNSIRVVQAEIKGEKKGIFNFFKKELNPEFTEEENELYLQNFPSRLTTYSVIPKLYEEWLKKSPNARKVPFHEKLALSVLETVRLEGRAKIRGKRYVWNRGNELAEIVIQYPSYGITYQQFEQLPSLPPYDSEKVWLPPNSIKAPAKRTPEQILYQIEVDRYFSLSKKKVLPTPIEKIAKQREHYEEVLKTLPEEERSKYPTFDERLAAREEFIKMYFQQPNPKNKISAKELYNIIQHPTPENYKKLKENYPLKSLSILDWKFKNNETNPFNPKVYYQKGRERILRKDMGQRVFKKSAITFAVATLLFTWMSIRNRDGYRQYLKHQWRLSETENPVRTENFVREKYLSKFEDEE